GNQPETGENQPEAGGSQPETGENQPETEADVENPINIAEPQGELMIDISNQDSRGNIGKVPGYAETEEISLSFEMTRGEDDTGAERLVWNHSNFGLKLTKKGHLVAKVDNNDGGFRDGYKIKDLDLNDGEAHQVTLMVDQNTDRLQVMVDGAVVLDETETDFDFAGGRERDWYVGDSVESLGVDDDVEFIDSSPNPYADLFA
uniref:LamG domain-containing protein n=1 Tax=uncultured Ruegeria sp. TaxID=259304 RepID=UPI00262FA2AD